MTSLPVSQWVPENWETMLSNIKEMRQFRNAPVDSMGAEQSADKLAQPKIQRYQILVSLMLSSQTKDGVNFAAMEKLKKYGLTPEIICETNDDELGKLIYPVGFWKRKVDFLKRTSKILLDQYEGDIPSTLEGLCLLPGVGPKMAHLVMSIAWNQTVGIGVDTHVHRISNRLGWLKTPTKTPEDTRKSLELWLPKEYWKEINLLLVGFGQQTCLPVKPTCKTCLNWKICPFARNTEF